MFVPIQFARKFEIRLMKIKNLAGIYTPFVQKHSFELNSFLKKIPVLFQPTDF